MSVTPSPRWTSNCTGCHREAVEVESRRTHGERVLCDGCADKPYGRPSAAALYAPKPSSNGNAAKRSTTTDATAAATPRLDYAETDMGNARRLVVDHRDRLRYVPGLGWICWDGARWARDGDGRAMRFAKRTVRGLDAEVAALLDAAALESDDAKRQKAQKAAASRLRHSSAAKVSRDSTRS